MHRGVNINSYHFVVDVLVLCIDFYVHDAWFICICTNVVGVHNLNSSVLHSFTSLERWLEEVGTTTNSYSERLCITPRSL